MPEMPVLRAYQQSAVAEVRAAFGARRRRVLFVLPTGGGKTVVFAHVASGAAARGRRVVIVVHRRELLRQASRALANAGVAHGLIAAGTPETAASVQVASVDTLVRRLDRVGLFDLVVIDEAHHAVAGTWVRMLEAFPEAFVLGVTATPERLDGRGLGGVFDAMVSGPSVADLTAAGWLVPAKVYAPPARIDLSGIRRRGGDYAVEELAEAMSDRVLVGNAVEHYRSLAAGVPAVAFCVNVAHSRLVADRFAAAGVRAAHVDGQTAEAERDRLIAALASGEIQVLSNCGLISEGVDVPALGAAILLRPTRSLGLYLQMVGRALRPAAGKVRALILDHASNTWTHGLPGESRAWSLDGRPKADRVARRAPGELFRRCPACAALHPPATSACEACGADLTAGPAEIAEIEAQLVEACQQEAASLAGQVREMSYGRAMRWAGTDPQRLVLVAQARGYKRGWVRHRLAEIETAGPC